MMAGEYYLLVNSVIVQIQTKTSGRTAATLAIHCQNSRGSHG